MKRVTVTELKNRLNEYLRQVKRGETLEVLERSVPIARVVTIDASSSSGDDVLERMIRAGIVRRPTRPPSRELLDDPPIPCAVDAVQVLIEQRGDR